MIQLVLLVGTVLLCNITFYGVTHSILRCILRRLLFPALENRITLCKWIWFLIMILNIACNYLLFTQVWWWVIAFLHNLRISFNDVEEWALLCNSTCSYLLFPSISIFLWHLVTRRKSKETPSTSAENSDDDHDDDGTSTTHVSGRIETKCSKCNTYKSPFTQTCSECSTLENDLDKTTNPDNNFFHKLIESWKNSITEKKMD